jgi:hypothetical protein
MPNKKEEEVVLVEGALPCRIRPSKKTLKAIEVLAEKYGCVGFSQEVVEHEKQLYLLLQIAWRVCDFEEKLLERFNDALYKLCKDSKEFLLD